mmetsp:Transcript_51534/g.122565  ORF Transcript_51534/g.122565 Transcript_51534/m.122565 type:complete len:474 (-) Transcript_51534:125-1546(-)
MASPAVAFTGSPPIYTPAALHGDLPPWAHPTPSPSPAPLLRHPGHGGTEGSGSARDSPVAPSSPPLLVSQELLWSICTPYIEQMLKELLRVCNSAQQDRLAVLAGTGSHSNGGAPGSDADKKEGDPDSAFCALFGAVDTAAGAERSEGSGTSHAETWLGTVSDRVKQPATSSPMSTGVAPGRGDRREPQKVTIDKGAGPEATASDSPGPLYVTFSQENKGLEASEQAAAPSGRSGSPGSLSKRNATAQAQHQLAHQPLQPQQQQQQSQHAPPHQQQHLQQPFHADEVLEESSVCRHWKTKGWCRLEANCKFLHPLQSRGMQQKNQAQKAGGNSGGPGTNHAMEFAGAAASSRSMGGDHRGAGGITADQGAAATRLSLVDALPSQQVEDLAMLSDLDQQQLNAMEFEAQICRHWKSKGWCRLEASCKFMHPVERRGPLAASNQADSGSLLSQGCHGGPAHRGMLGRGLVDAGCL